MIRKNNPKQTIEKIVAVSTKLFLENGYEKTSMQNIVDALGMSKGAIFHHFKSKEEILHAVFKKQTEDTEQIFSQWIEEMKGLSAKEKLVGLLGKNMNDKNVQATNSIFASQYQNPHFIVATIQQIMNKGAPLFAKILREGIEDGSVTTEFPDECAEVFFLLINLWCDSAFFECDTERLGRRFKFLQQMMKKMGVDIMSDEVLADCIQYDNEFYKGTKKS